MVWGNLNLWRHEDKDDDIVDARLQNLIKQFAKEKFGKDASILSSDEEEPGENVPQTTPPRTSVSTNAKKHPLKCTP